LSEKTISAHKQKILHKLGVDAITQVGENENPASLGTESQFA
jgi:DNA-binding NarL/FixJ family response regulator